MDRNSTAVIAGLVAVLILVLFINGGVGLPQLTPVETTKESEEASELPVRSAPAEEGQPTASDDAPPASSPTPPDVEPPSEPPPEAEPPVSGPGGQGLHFLGKLEAAARDTGAKETHDFMYQHHPEEGMYIVYYGKRGASAKLWRFYPETYSVAQIKADITGAAPITYDWPAGTPDPETYTEEVFLTENLIESSEFIMLEDDCRRYMGGDGCAVGVLTNPYGLEPGRLEQDTGPYEWSRSKTLTEIRVLPAGKLFLAWSFGDAGLRSFDYSIWDTTTGEHSLVSGYGGSMGESMDITVAQNNGTEGFVILDFGFYKTASTTDVYDEDMFAEVQEFTVFPDEHCVTASPTPKDRTDPAAPWLVEYEFSCPSIGYDLATQYYELDPAGGTMTPLTGVLLQ